MRRRNLFTLAAGACAGATQKGVPFSGLGSTMTFDQQWAAARYNWQYWASYAAMFIAPLVGATFVALYFRRRPVARRAWHIILALFVFLLTAEITVDSIGRKWESRVAAARTDEEYQAVATRDANLMFAPIIGGLCGAASVAVWCSAAWVAGRVIRRRFQRDEGGSGVPAAGPAR